MHNLTDNIEADLTEKAWNEMPWPLNDTIAECFIDALSSAIFHRENVLKIETETDLWKLTRPTLVWLNGQDLMERWSIDEFSLCKMIVEYGLPAYEYTCDQYTDPNALTATTYGYSMDHFHQIGNDRIAATAHNGGYIQVLESSRGFQWLTYRDSRKFKLGGGITLMEFDKSGVFYSDLYTSEVMKIGLEYRRIFGMGTERTS